MRKLLLFILMFFSVGLIVAQTTTSKYAVTKKKQPIVKFEKAVKNTAKKTAEKYLADRNPLQPQVYLGHCTIKDFSTHGTKALLYSNGPIITNAGTGPGGSDFSLLESPNGTYGFGHSISSHYMIADNVIVNATSWTIDSIGFYAYQTGSSTTSSITEYQVMIYDGNPANVGSSVIWGDTVTNRLSSTDWSGIYRGDDTTNTDRPVMLSYVNTSGLVLTSGEYWIAWGCAGSLTSGPWAPPITISGQPGTGDAIQWNTTDWTDVVDAEPQGFPFDIYGTEVAATCPFPTDLNASNITDIAVDLSWTENGSATTWDIEYGAAGFTPTGTPTTAGITSIPYSLTGLTASTEYDFYVRADCGGGDYSDWFGPYTFSTQGCDPSLQCTFTMNFVDAFGDGWNGAAIDIYENSVYIGEYTLPGGATVTSTVDLCDSANIDLIWVSGGYDSECSFSMEDANGTSITAFADGSVYVDGDTIYSFTVACPSCPIPNSLMASDITMTSADLSWTENGSASTWDIEWGTVGFTQGTGTMVTSATSNPYNLTGLTASTEYDFYVRADCGGGDYSNWVGPYTFHTEGCDTSNQCYYVLDLHDSYGDGWNGSVLAIAQDGIIVKQFTLTTGTSATDSVALCDGSSIILTWLQGSFDDEISFEFYDPFGLELVAITDASTLTNGQLVYNYTASCTPPSCPKPTALTTGNLTTTTADLDWTPAGSETEWQIEYGTSGFTPGTGILVITSTHPYTLSGLNVGSPYDYYVRAICSVGDSSYWAGPYSFNTQCNVISTFGWVDDFESGAIPCWSIVANNTATWYLDDGSNSTPNSGSYDMVIDYDSNLGTQNEFLYSPVFDLTSIATPEITFFWSMSYYWSVFPNDNYDVFLLATGDSGATWDTLWTEPIDSFDNWFWYDTTLSLTAYTASTDFQFAFKYSGSDGAAFYLDDVRIDYPVNSENAMEVNSNIKLYPNPTNGYLYITNAVNAEVVVYNVIGDAVYSGKLEKSYIDISNLNTGTYIVKIKSNHSIATKKISLIK